MICIVITGIIKIIVYSRGKHHRHQCQEGKQIANPLFLIIKYLYDKKKKWIGNLLAFLALVTVCLLYTSRCV